MNISRSYIEIIYVDDEGNARKTDMAYASPAQKNPNKETRARFNEMRVLQVIGDEQPRFLIDYHNAKGDLGETIGITAEDFEIVAGEKPKTNAEYIEIDENYWRRTKEQVAKVIKAKAPTGQGESIAAIVMSTIDEIREGKKA